MSWRAWLVIAMMTGFGLVCLGMSIALSQERKCDQQAALLGILSKQFHEQRLFFGAIPDRNGDIVGTMIVTVAPNGGWSVLRCITATQVCCFTAAGNGATFLPGA